MRRRTDELELKACDQTLEAACREIQDKQDEIERLKSDCARYAEETGQLERDLVELDHKNQGNNSMTNQIKVKERELEQAQTRHRLSLIHI